VLRDIAAVLVDVPGADLADEDIHEVAVLQAVIWTPGNEMAAKSRRPAGPEIAGDPARCLPGADAC
jgi:hypothetical protein